METIPAIVKTVLKTLLRILFVGALLIFSTIVGYFTPEYLFFEGTIHNEDRSK